jgi:hypothetical protein
MNNVLNLSSLTTTEEIALMSWSTFSVYCGGKPA